MSYHANHEEEYCAFGGDGVLLQYCGRQFCPQIFRTSKSGRSAGTLMVQLKHHRVYRMPVRCTHGKSIELTRSEHSRGFGLISLNSPAQNHAGLYRRAVRQNRDPLNLCRASIP